MLDTSALAILCGEQNADALIDVITLTEQRVLSATSVLEASLVAYARKGANGLDNLDVLIKQLKLSTYSFDDEQNGTRSRRLRPLRKGRHPAALNFGDCFAYGLARRLAQSLLFVGNDFSQTDMPSVSSS